MEIIKKSLIPMAAIGAVFGAFYSCFDGMSRSGKNPKPMTEMPYDICMCALIGGTWPISVPILGSIGIYRKLK